MLKVDLSGASSFFDAAGPDFAAAASAHRTLAERSGAGADFTGWLDLPQKVKAGELRQVLAAASHIRGRSETLVVVGIGGSYLGAKGAIELLRPRPQSGDPRIIFAGNSMSPDALMGLLEELGETDFDINVISKSGTTLEPALAFRMFRGLLEAKYGPDKAKKRIIATTDAKRGGLLPMAVAGIDVSTVIDAAIDAFAAMDQRSPENPAWQYAAARQHLYRLGKSIEILACYEPSFRFMAEWWKQLYGESEGKNGIGIYPASVEYNADLHSMGQYVQDGPRTLMETVVSFDSPQNEFTVPFAMGDPDQLNYLAGRKLSDISRVAQEAVKAAHIAGGVPNMEVRVDKRDEVGFAQLVAFFELACGISGYMSGVNPFDQPGVEAYKKNMFRLLEKPGAV